MSRLSVIFKSDFKVICVSGASDGSQIWGWSTLIYRGLNSWRRIRDSSEIEKLSMPQLKPVPVMRPAKSMESLGYRFKVVSENSNARRWANSLFCERNSLIQIRHSRSLTKSVLILILIPLVSSYLSILAIFDMTYRSICLAIPSSSAMGMKTPAACSWPWSPSMEMYASWWKI